ncbi:unnamed protein product [Brassica oleracea]
METRDYIKLHSMLIKVCHFGEIVTRMEMDFNYLGTSLLK